MTFLPDHSLVIQLLLLKRNNEVFKQCFFVINIIKVINTLTNVIIFILSRYALAIFFKFQLSHKIFEQILSLHLIYEFSSLYIKTIAQVSHTQHIARIVFGISSQSFTCNSASSFKKK